jgi:hypothetical protein
MTDIPPEVHGRFPGFDTLAEADAWDDVTRAVVSSRVDSVPHIVFFSDSETRTARVLLDRLLDQADESRVPVVEFIDARLAAGEGDGYRYADMPDDATAWRRSLAALDQDARDRFDAAFVDLTGPQQHAVIQQVQDHDGDWHGMPAKRVFGLWMRYACTAFYAHPAAWNEIGFGGPAYPRGYKNIGIARREPWEVAERDADDPVAWAERADAARSRHAGRFAGAHE